MSLDKRYVSVLCGIFVFATLCELEISNKKDLKKILRELKTPVDVRIKEKQIKAKSKTSQDIISLFNKLVMDPLL